MNVCIYLWKSKSEENISLEDNKYEAGLVDGYV